MQKRILVALAVLVPAISVGLVWRLPRKVDQRWLEMVAWAEEAAREWEQLDFERPPTWGAVTDGSAFAAYAVAIDQTSELREQDEDLLRDLRLAPEEVPVEEAEEFARRWARPLAAMSEGAHRRDARPPIEWEAGFAHPTARLLVWRDLVNAGTIEVRRRLAQGRPRAAVELALDAATLASDLRQSPVLIDQMVACALVAIATAETWRDEDLRRLDAPSLELLAAGLAEVDARCPVTCDWRGESLLLAHALIAVDGRVGELSAESVSMDTGGFDGSERRMAADAVLTQVQAWERIGPAGAVPWSTRQEQLELVMDRPEVRRNPVLAIAMPNWASAERSLRSTAANVRLLRVAVALRLGQAAPTLSDPLGEGALQIEAAADGGARVSSLGLPGARALERIVAPR